MTQIQCSVCSIIVCKEDITQAPKTCPRKHAPDALDRAEHMRTTEPGIIKMTEVAGAIEKEGYRVWPRVRELIEFCKGMKSSELGVAFCVGLAEETRSLVKILQSHDFAVSSVCCTVNKGCNPVGQALVLNEVGTELNIIMGLCMGHDILFSQNSTAPVTTLVVKDRVNCHNPAAPLTNRYWRDTFLKGE